MHFGSFYDGVYLHKQGTITDVYGDIHVYDFMFAWWESSCCHGHYIWAST